MPEHILVVEDDPQIADLLRRGLIYEGYWSRSPATVPPA